MRPLFRLGLPVLLLTCALAGCEPGERPVGDMAPGIEPFDRLGSIALGATGAEVASARPHARPAAYLGYSEVVGPYQVGYQLRGAERYEGGRVPRHWRLEAVRAHRPFPADSVAARAYTRLVQRTTRALGRRPTCRAGAAGRFALWRLSDGSDLTLAVSGSRITPMIDPRTGQREASEAPPSLFVEVARRSLFRDLLSADRPADPAIPPWRPEACPP
jgi:hypothetical protein